MDIFININLDKNPQWPPQIGLRVAIRKPIQSNDNRIFIGIIRQHIMNQTACVVELLNHKNYHEKNHKKSHILLLPLYGWTYLNDDTDCEILNYVIDPTTNMISDIEDIYPITQEDLRLDSTYIKADILDKKNDKSKKSCNPEDDYPDTSLLDDRGEINMNELFIENNNLDTGDTDEFKSPGTETMIKLIKQINKPYKLDIDDQKIIVNKTVAIRNLITTKEDEINEGKKIIEWIRINMMDTNPNNDLFKDLKMIIHNGYVHIGRTGIPVTDTITPKLVKDLKYLKWQYGIAIDYDTLKYILFQNDIQRNIQRNIEQQKEAEDILSQEYLIGLQPEPKYQMWCLKRLIMCWYGDVDLQNNIRKIKVLVNQWRCRNDVEFNKKFGILPSIVVYPKYGKESARLVLLRLGTYFLYYTKMGWKCSEPTYFIRLNDMLSYTNGTIDLKMYFKKVKTGYKKSVENTSFVEEYSLVKGAEKIIYDN
jgi:hypothetical protein